MIGCRARTESKRSRISSPQKIFRFFATLYGCAEPVAGDRATGRSAPAIWLSTWLASSAAPPWDRSCDRPRYGIDEYAPRVTRRRYHEPGNSELRWSRQPLGALPFRRIPASAGGSAPSAALPLSHPHGLQDGSSRADFLFRTEAPQTMATMAPIASPLTLAAKNGPSNGHRESSFVSSSRERQSLVARGPRKSSP